MKLWKTVMFLLVVGSVNVLLAGCGGGNGPTSPSVPDSIAGTWTGTITFTRPTPMTVPTTWTFTPIAQTSGYGFEARGTWAGITTRAVTATVIGSQFSLSGTYPSPRGCDGTFGGLGTAEARVIDTAFSGSSSCDSVFDGHMRLSR